MGRGVGKSGFKGIYQNQNGKFGVNIYPKGETIYLGSFATIEEAIQIRDKAKEEFGIIDDNRSQKEKRKEYEEKNREKLIETRNKWRQKNSIKVRSYKRKYQLKNKEEINQNKKNRRKQIKTNAINAYGGKCACCGITDINFLTIDHMDNNGAKHRKEIGKGGGAAFYKWLRDNNYPKDLNLQVLCWNCNCGRHFNNGVCPHKQNINEILYDEEVGIE